jgi:hypothetical protein
MFGRGWRKEILVYASPLSEDSCPLLSRHYNAAIYRHVTTVRHAARLFTISRVIRDYAMTLPLQPAESWHSHYDDPNGDLILVSNE